jgi:hypothetical protein
MMDDDEMKFCVKIFIHGSEKTSGIAGWLAKRSMEEEI